MAYITTTALKDYLTFDSDDTEIMAHLGQLCLNAQEFIKSYIGFNPEGTEFYYRDLVQLNGPKIALPYAPVISVSSCLVNGAEYTAIIPEGVPEGRINGTDFYIDNQAGILTFQSLDFYGQALLEITFIYGFQAVPADIIQAGCELVAWNYGKIKNQGFGVKSQTVGESTTAFETGAPYSVRQILDRYKK